MLEVLLLQLQLSVLLPLATASVRRILGLSLCVHLPNVDARHDKLWLGLLNRGKGYVAFDGRSLLQCRLLLCWLSSWEFLLTIREIPERRLDGRSYEFLRRLPDRRLVEIFIIST